MKYITTIPVCKLFFKITTSDICQALNHRDRLVGQTRLMYQRINLFSQILRFRGLREGERGGNKYCVAGLKNQRH